MITIFTPTYNRAYRLPNLYKSLQRQTCTDFEWVIVDDGSQDETRELVEGWILESNLFDIRYFQKENGGKHTAINLGVEKARYDWFFIVDSDDYVTDDAVEKIHSWITTIDNPMIAAVSGTKRLSNGDTIGQCAVEEHLYVDAKNNERKKYKLQGDKAEVYRTDILRKYPFPMFAGENFLTEAAVWDKIAMAGYKVRWFRYPTVVCEYLPDGLTNQLNQTSIEVRNFEGFTYSTKVALRAYRGIERIRCICRYINKAREKGLTLRSIAHRIDIPQYYVGVLTVPVFLKNRFKKSRVKL